MIDDVREKLGKLTKDDVLGLVGLESRRSVMDYVLPAVGIFAAGVVVGAGLGLLLAPKAGRELRADLGERAHTLADQVSSEASKVRGKLEGRPASADAGDARDDGAEEAMRGHA
jgi:hypothetical protein